ncbi:hypothetical protein HS041_32565 [Planomonospora sp. ID67723]|uniref:hypothetical protein n=1 Tax=Planomonospora sp. ID67723 TaxID=2738134 RepID=UPI0018C3C4E8|nr:hypothetical protein [Planomonospora sp. ID67723]MBG0832441.1 hypothetical protein [Planomonospora sp. ID67723]
MNQQGQTGPGEPERQEDGFPVAGQQQSPLSQSPDAEPEGDAVPGEARDWLPSEAQSPDDME